MDEFSETDAREAAEKEWTEFQEHLRIGGKAILHFRSIYSLGARWAWEKAQGEIASLKSELETFRAGYAPFLHVTPESYRELEAKLKIATEALEKVSDKRRLRDMSRLTSNPPQNGAVRDIQVIVNEALSEMAKIRGDK